MIKKILKRALKWGMSNLPTVIIFLIIIGFLKSCEYGNRLNLLSNLFNRSASRHRTVYIDTPRSIDKTMHEDKLPFKYRLKYREARVDTVYEDIYEPWLEDIWTAHTIIKKGNRMEIKMKKGEQVLTHIMSGVPCDFELYGTNDGMRVVYPRFTMNWLKWDGLRVGVRYGLAREVMPYVSAGFHVKRLEFKAELNKEDLRADINLRIF